MTRPRGELPMGAIDRMVHRWNAEGVPVGARLEEALKRLEMMAADRLRLDQRIRLQRLALRQNWMITEERVSHRRAWRQSPLLLSLLRRNRPPPWYRRVAGYFWS
jgi:hypothetical protein